jgi:hypothetical protein
MPPAKQIHLATGPNFAFVKKLLTFGEDSPPHVDDVLVIESSELIGPPAEASEIEATVTAVKKTTLSLRATGKKGGEYKAPREAYFRIKSSPTISAIWEEHLQKQTPDGVAFADGLIPPALRKRLQADVEGLLANEPADYHPGSGTRVRDIVHPSLYPFVKGKSVTTKPVPKRKDPTHDRWGRTYESSDYQWLPTPFAIDKGGKVSVASYINNLDREKYGAVYDDLAALFAHALPLLESVLGYVAQTEFLREGLDKDEGDFPNEKGPARKKAIKPRSLRSRELQVIPKIVEYRLGEGEDHEGVWHVEGMSHEHIVATCLFVLDRDDGLQGGELRFKRAYTLEEAGKVFWNISQSRPGPVEDMVEEGTIPVGSVATPKGRLLVFPNSHIHKLTPLTLAEGTTEGRRRVIVFWVVDPDVAITSTREVPPQQGVIKHKEALKIRLALMEERRRHKQSLNVRAVSLCEH